MEEKLLHIPNSFREKIIGAFRETGIIWLEGLEHQLEKYLSQWGLTFVGPVSNLSYNYVSRVTNSKGESLILKLGVPNQDFQNEVNALMAYDGVGCARLIKSDAENGAMLLEQLSPGRMLSTLKDEEQVVKAFSKVWKELRRPTPDGVIFPSLHNWMSSLSSYRDSSENQEEPLIPHEYINLAEVYFREITGSAPSVELLHGDLHHENILYSEASEWTGIDPKGVIGDPHFDVVSFLVNHLHNKENPRVLLKYRVDRLSEELHFDRTKVLKAAVAMSTLYAVWGVEDKDPDWENTLQCTKWFQEWIES